MKKLSLILATILSIVMLAGCGGNDLVGRWEDKNSGKFLEFFNDGNYTSDQTNYSGSYSVEGNRVRLSGILMPDKVYTFDISGDELTTYYEDGSVARVYVKQ